MLSAQLAEMADLLPKFNITKKGVMEEERGILSLALFILCIRIQTALIIIRNNTYLKGYLIVLNHGDSLWVSVRTAVTSFDGELCMGE